MRDVVNTSFQASAQGNTITFSPSNGSVNSNITVPSPLNASYPGVMRFVNNGGTIAFIRQGIGVQTATAADIPLPINTSGGGVLILQLQATTTNVAVFSTGPVTVYGTPGYGGMSA